MSKDRMIIEIAGYIDNNLTDDLTIEKVSNQMHFNRYYLMKSFKAKLGSTINNYINQIRIINSINYLKDNNLKILNVALKSGFLSQEYYSAQFKKLIGVSPMRFRTLLKNSKIKTISSEVEVKKEKKDIEVIKNNLRNLNVIKNITIKENEKMKDSQKNQSLEEVLEETMSISKQLKMKIEKDEMDNYGITINQKLKESQENNHDNLKVINDELYQIQKTLATKGTIDILNIKFTSEEIEKLKEKEAVDSYINALIAQSAQRINLTVTRLENLVNDIQETLSIYKQQYEILSNPLIKTKVQNVDLEKLNEDHWYIREKILKVLLDYKKENNLDYTAEEDELNFEEYIDNQISSLSPEQYQEYLDNEGIRTQLYWQWVSNYVDQNTEQKPVNAVEKEEPVTKKDHEKIVFIANKNFEELSGLDIIAGSSHRGFYSAEEIIKICQEDNMYRLILDITALKDYQEIKTFEKLTDKIDSNKILLYLDRKDEKVISDDFIASLENINIKNYTKMKEGIEYFYNKAMNQ